MIMTANDRRQCHIRQLRVFWWEDYEIDESKEFVKETGPIPSTCALQEQELVAVAKPDLADE